MRGYGLVDAEPVAVRYCAGVAARYCAAAAGSPLERRI